MRKAAPITQGFGIFMMMALPHHAMAAPPCTVTIGFDDSTPPEGTHRALDLLAPPDCRSALPAVPLPAPKPVMPEIDDADAIEVPAGFVPERNRESFNKIMAILPRIVRNTGASGVFRRNGYQPVAVILAMIKQESNFDPVALSRAGAAGWSQAMPDTFYKICSSAKNHFDSDISANCDEIAKTIDHRRRHGRRVSRPTEDRLFDDFYAKISAKPWPILAFHAQYMKELISDFEYRQQTSSGRRALGATNPVILAVAAYNGGPSNIVWKMHAGGETDNYWRKVLLYYDQLMRYNGARAARAGT